VTPRGRTARAPTRGSSSRPRPTAAIPGATPSSSANRRPGSPRSCPRSPSSPTAGSASPTTTSATWRRTTRRRSRPTSGSRARRAAATWQRRRRRTSRGRSTSSRRRTPAAISSATTRGWPRTAPASSASTTSRTATPPAADRTRPTPTRSGFRSLDCLSYPRGEAIAASPLCASQRLTKRSGIDSVEARRSRAAGSAGARAPED
jgi:hypothetical protein